MDEATCIAAVTREAADDMMKWYGMEKKVYVVPDRIELDHFPLKRRHQHQDITRFIWYGMAQNRSALFAAVATLDRLWLNGVKFSITILDDHPEIRWTVGQQFPTYHAKWTLDNENAILADHDIALLPPYPGPWGKLKSNNRQLTAWACGLPVTDAMDYYQTYELATRAEKRRNAAQTGYQRLLADYQMEKTAQQWLEIVEMEDERCYTE